MQSRSSNEETTRMKNAWPPAAQHIPLYGTPSREMKICINHKSLRVRVYFLRFKDPFNFIFFKVKKICTTIKAALISICEIRSPPIESLTFI